MLSKCCIPNFNLLQLYQSSGSKCADPYCEENKEIYIILLFTIVLQFQDEVLQSFQSFKLQLYQIKSWIIHKKDHQVSVALTFSWILKTGKPCRQSYSHICVDGDSDYVEQFVEFEELNNVIKSLEKASFNYTQVCPSEITNSEFNQVSRTWW